MMGGRFIAGLVGHPLKRSKSFLQHADLLNDILPGFHLAYRHCARVCKQIA